MTEQDESLPKRVDYVKSTKKQIYDAYNELRKQLEEKRKAEQTPEQKIAEQKVAKVVQEAGDLSIEGVAEDIGALKSETGKLLSQLSERLESAVYKYQSVQSAIEAKEKELAEIYEIQKSATSLAALVELQRRQKDEFEADAAQRRDEMEAEIESTRSGWKREKALHEEAEKEREAQEKKRREREKEEFEYNTKREKELAKQKLQDELADLERAIALKKGELERELGERERAVGAKEAELAELRQRVEGHSAEMEKAVNRAVKEATDRLAAVAANKEQLLQKEFEGERNVLKSRIESLEKTVKEQAELLANLNRQLEKSYNQVQDIATKAIEGSAAVKSISGLEQILAEQKRKTSKEE